MTGEREQREWERGVGGQVGEWCVAGGVVLGFLCDDDFALCLGTAMIRAACSSVSLPLLRYLPPSPAF